MCSSTHFTSVSTPSWSTTLVEGVISYRLWARCAAGGARLLFSNWITTLTALAELPLSGGGPLGGVCTASYLDACIAPIAARELDGT